MPRNEEDFVVSMLRQPIADGITFTVTDTDRTMGTGVRPAVIGDPPPAEDLPTVAYRPSLTLEEAEKLGLANVVQVTERLYARDPKTGVVYVAAVPGNRLTADHHAQLTGI